MIHHQFARVTTLASVLTLLFTTHALSQPVISNVVLSDTTQHSVTVSWDTDVATKTRINLGFAGEDFIFNYEDDNFLTSHSVVFGLFEVNLKTQSDYRMMSGTSYDFQIVAVDAADDSTFDVTRNVVTTSFGGGALPAGWMSQDIGSVGSAGMSTYNATLDMWQVRGGGTQLYQDLDSFHFLYHPIDGDFEYTIQVRSYAGYLNRFTKAGHLFRAELDKRAQMYSQSVNYNAADFLYYREFPDSVHTDILQTQLQMSIGDSLWLKMERSGNDFTQSYGYDGTTWFVHGPASTNVPLPSTGYIGVPTVSKYKPLLSEVFYSDFSFAELADTTDPIISNVVSTGNLDSLTVTWDTNENTDSKIEYGLTVAYGDSLVETALVADHTLVLTGLLEGVYYHYRIVATDNGGNVVEDIDRFYTYGLLPVEMTEFVATADGNAVVLTWSTASESGNAGFEIEHRTNGGFEVVDFVEGAGHSSSQTDYSYRIEDLEPGTHYFRLRQINASGSSVYTAEVEATVELNTAYNISASYPNPFSARTAFTLAVGQTQDVEISVYNMLGQRVATLFDEPLSANQITPVAFDGTNMASGVYVVVIEGEHFTESLKVMRVQ